MENYKKTMEKNIETATQRTTTTTCSLCHVPPRGHDHRQLHRRDDAADGAGDGLRAHLGARWMRARVKVQCWLQQENWFNNGHK